MLLPDAFALVTWVAPRRTVAAAPPGMLVLPARAVIATVPIAVASALFLFWDVLRAERLLRDRRHQKPQQGHCDDGNASMPREFAKDAVHGSIKPAIHVILPTTVMAIS
jgi:predicted DNA repair protein MutK